MKKLLSTTLLLLSAAVISCTPKEEEQLPSGDAEMELSISSDSFYGEWKEGDTVSILDNSGNHVFTALSSGNTVSFKGKCDTRAAYRVVLAPYTKDAVYKGDSLCFTLPSRQKGDAGNYAVALSSTENIRMKSINSAFTFSFFSEDIKSVDVESTDGERLGGSTAVIFNKKIGGFSVRKRGNDKILSLIPEDGEEFLKAGKYRLACLPSGATAGLKFTLHYPKSDAVFTIDRAITLKAGEVIDFGDIESCAIPSETGTFNINEVQLPARESAYEISLVFIDTPSSTQFLWPFSSPGMSEISYSWGSGKSSFPAQKVRLKTADGAYSLEAFGTIGLTRNGGANQGLKIGGAKGDYIAFPAIKGLYLNRIEWITGACNAGGAKIIKTSDESPVQGGDPLMDGTTTKGQSIVWDLYGSEKETSYKLCFGQTDAQCFQKLILSYDVKPLEDPASGFQEVLEDEIPDFSRVGYHYGDKPIPDIPVRMTISAPEDGSDALNLIQEAIDKVQTPGAVLLKAGTYNVSGTIEMKRDGVVLRGEGEGRTILKCTAESQVARLITLGKITGRSISTGSRIIAKYVPVGQMWVPVAHPELFSVGERVFVYRPATQEWLHDLGMDNLAELYPGNTNWTPESYGIYWERTVTAIEGHKIHLDNPIVMCIGGEEKYGSGMLYKGSWTRVRECGIENLSLDTVYDPGVKKGSDFVDENHCLSAITVRGAEHCWIRNITGSHFYLSTVELGSGAKHVTVTDCTSLSPVSEVTGGRRYAFHFSNSQLCLVQNCKCDDDRHQFVCGARASGPNVFLRCTSTKARSDAGPHQRWASGTLYDNVKVAGDLNIQDRAGWGTGHGWAGVNFVCWNCEAKRIAVQSPWVTGQNWAIGCIGTKISGTYVNFKDKLGPRPDGRWSSQGVHVSPESLYESQLEKRHAEGIYFE